MNTLRSSLALVALVALATGVADTAQAAATLSTGPVRVSADPAHGDLLRCGAVNVGTKEIEVVITATLDDTFQSPPLFVTPGQTATIFNPNSGPSSANGFCRFTIKGGKKNVRASACALDQNNNCRAAAGAD